MDEPKVLCLDAEDQILKPFCKGSKGIFINEDQRNEYDKKIPLAFRSMTRRKLIHALWEEKRDFYYIDTGYLGNREKRKNYHRVVKNNVQHADRVKELPSDRWRRLVARHPYLEYKGAKYLGDREAILLVTPSEKPCKFYNVNRDVWLNKTIDEIKKHTDRPIIVRNKPDRRDRVGDKSIYEVFETQKIHSVVTYNSIAAVEAIHYGIPAYSEAPNAATTLCFTNLDQIDKKNYPSEAKVMQWLHYLAYCQYTTSEMAIGLPLHNLREYRY